MKNSMLWSPAVRRMPLRSSKEEVWIVIRENLYVIFVSLRRIDLMVGRTESVVRRMETGGSFYLKTMGRGLETAGEYVDISEEAEGGGTSIRVQRESRI